MSDDEFVLAVEDCTFPGEAFHHREHLRLAWIYLRRYGPAEAETRTAQTILRFATSNGAPAKFNAELTRAWLGRIREAIAHCPPDASFDDVLRHDMMENLSHEHGNPKSR